LPQIEVFSLVEFNELQLDKLRAVSPALSVQQLAGVPCQDLPAVRRERVEILYGWGKLVAEAHRLPRLRWLQMHSAGIDSLLDKPIWQTDVLISSMNGIHSVQMAEHALALVLAFRSRIPKMLGYQQRSEWPQNRWDKFVGPELRGSTLGIIGYGAIGRELARQARALGMRVLAVNRSGRRRLYRGFNEPDTGDPEATIPTEIYSADHLLAVLPACDYVVVLTPLTPETHHIFDEGSFAAMKPGAFFFNLARGPLVDESALVAALKRGHLGGAGLDVFEHEPRPADHPLWTFDNVIISPHVSGFSPMYDERASTVFAENLRRYMAGEPLLNQAERGRGY
jgi:phosphoglycerate dehydrogenase-like enzyme